MYTCIHTYIHAYIHMHTYMHTYTCTYIHRLHASRHQFNNIPLSSSISFSVQFDYITKIIKTINMTVLRYDFNLPVLLRALLCFEVLLCWRIVVNGGCLHAQICSLTCNAPCQILTQVIQTPDTASLPTQRRHQRISKKV